MPDQGFGGCGGRQRSAPTGGAAYGMPRNSRVAVTVFPRTAPSAVVTTGPWLGLWLWLWLWLGPGVAVVVQAAAAISTAAAARPPASLIRTYWPIGVTGIVALAWSGRNGLTVLNH